jgi:hypothetical protein
MEEVFNDNDDDGDDDDDDNDERRVSGHQLKRIMVLNNQHTV